MWQRTEVSTCVSSSSTDQALDPYKRHGKVVRVGACKACLLPKWMDRNMPVCTTWAVPKLALSSSSRVLPSTNELIPLRTASPKHGTTSLKPPETWIVSSVVTESSVLSTLVRASTRPALAVTRVSRDIDPGRETTRTLWSKIWRSGFSS
jgi:hypothetical protein